MKMEIFYDSTVEAFKVDDFDISKVMDLLEKSRKRGIEVVMHDTAGWDDAMRMEHYLRGVVPAVMKKYGIRKVFGSARTSGWLFGRQVPALIVSEGGKVIDIYPHQFAGKRYTVLEFLRKMSSELKEG